jgi:predicted O-linked N-acetylglucosamine transferase (SPINDLY family)
MSSDQKIFAEAAAHVEAGRYEEAEKLFRQILRKHPQHLPAIHELGKLLVEIGQPREAVELFRKAIAIKPDFADAHYNLGLVLNQLGELDQALVMLRKAMFLKPQWAKVHNLLGIVLTNKIELDEAILALRRSIALNPKFAAAHANLGLALARTTFLGEALDAYSKALELDPTLEDVWSARANALMILGRLDESLAAYEKAIELNPDKASHADGRLYALHNSPDYDAERLLAEKLEYDVRYASQFRDSIPRHPNNRSPDRKLRIGYVSPDFREHVVGWNIFPILQHHDREKFEIFLYSNVSRADELTNKFKSAADGWRPITGIPDEAVAKTIREDRIDILIDLSLHSADNRLMVFARKPAPVQMCYLGYCDGTALEAMDYRLSDHFLDSPETEKFYREKTLYFPHCYWCYKPGRPAADPAPPPEIANGFITFGTLCNFSKFSPATQDLWARVLLEAKNSRLLVSAHPGDHRQKVLDRFASHGVDPARIEFVARQGWDPYIAIFSRIDIALDPIPYNGGISTCDTLWMGVPVVSLTGKTAVGRAGKSILMNLNLGDLVAKTPDEFVAIAAQLANDRPRREHLRRNLRQMMINSPITNTAQFTADLESLYRQAWRTWCAS